VRRRERLPRPFPFPFLPDVSVAAACARNAAALACVARAKIEVAYQAFAEVCRRIETDLDFQSTSPVSIRIEHGLCTVRVYRDGILWQVISKPTPHDLRESRDLRDPLCGNR